VIHDNLAFYNLFNIRDVTSHCTSIIRVSRSGFSILLWIIEYKFIHVFWCKTILSRFLHLIFYFYISIFIFLYYLFLYFFEKLYFFIACCIRNRFILCRIINYNFKNELVISCKFYICIFTSIEMQSSNKFEMLNAHFVLNLYVKREKKKDKHG